MHESNGSNHCVNDSSEDGCSLVPPIDDRKQTKITPLSMGGAAETTEDPHRHSSYAEAVTNGYSQPIQAPSLTANTEDNTVAAAPSNDLESSSLPQDPPSITPQHHPRINGQQPISFAGSEQRNMSFTFESSSRANTPSGIMREMSLKDQTQYFRSGEMDGADEEGMNRFDQTPGFPGGDKGCTETAATTTIGGMGAVLSEHDSQQKHQITTYYSIASQASLPIHTPTAVASNNNQWHLSKELLRSPEHTLERLSFILGKGRLVMV